MVRHSFYSLSYIDIMDQKNNLKNLSETLHNVGWPGGGKVSKLMRYSGVRGQKIPKMTNSVAP